MPEPTELQYAEAKQSASSWAKERLHDRNTLIVDTETTGILRQDPETEIVQLSVINTKGQPVFNALINPGRPIPLFVSKIHGITSEDIIDSPKFTEIAPLLYKVFEGKHIVCYNAAFDVHLICHLFKKHKCPQPDFQVSCAMEEYAKWNSVWDSRKDDFKWQKLPKLAYGKAHDSLTDCMSTLEILKLMAYERKTDDSELVALDF